MWWTVILLMGLSAGSSASRDRVCDLFVGVDEPFWENHGKNMTEIHSFVEEHVRVLNVVFTKQILNQAPLDDVEFRLGRLQVMFGSCDSFEDYRTNCTAQRDKFLRAFDRHDFSEFCLAFLFSHRDFNNGTAGYAYVGTVCSKTQNSGFITTLNYGADRSIQDSTVTFAHEVGHNFGATHDSAYKDTDCVKRDYIMNEVYDDTLHPNVDGEDYKFKFSDCSIRDIRKKLSKLISEDEECFKPKSYFPEKAEVAVCGNGIIEPGEECDCGTDPIDCSDFCCYPAHISDSDRNSNMTAIPCTLDWQKFDCMYPPGLIYGIYLPFGFIIVSAVGIFFALRWDWRRKRIFFQHISKNNIRIIKS